MSLRQRLHQSAPVTYLISSGETTSATKPTSVEFERVLDVVRASVRAGIDLVQLREKHLHTRVLYELAWRAAQITHSSSSSSSGRTRLLVNDRFDVALAARADGVHLTTTSLAARDVRRVVGREFIVGVSAHSLNEAREAQTAEADFATFSPVFATQSKLRYGQPLGLKPLSEAAAALDPFPLIALGGITLENIPDALRAGACGIAGITLFGNASGSEERFKVVVEAVKEQ